MGRPPPVSEAIAKDLVLTDDGAGRPPETKQKPARHLQGRALPEGRAFALRQSRKGWKPKGRDYRLGCTDSPASTSARRARKPP